MLDIWQLNNIRIVVWVKEVDVIGKPAYTKDKDKNNEHFDNLERENDQI